MYTCTACGCTWDESGFYVYDGVVEQPCIECRKDESSKHYYNHQLEILEKRRQAYYDNHESRKAYFRDKRREYREAQRAASA